MPRKNKLPVGYRPYDRTPAAFDIIPRRHEAKLTKGLLRRINGKPRRGQALEQERHQQMLEYRNLTFDMRSKQTGASFPTLRRMIAAIGDSKMRKHVDNLRQLAKVELNDQTLDESLICASKLTEAVDELIREMEPLIARYFEDVAPSAILPFVDIARHFEPAKALLRSYTDFTRQIKTWDPIHRPALATLAYEKATALGPAFNAAANAVVDEVLFRESQASIASTSTYKEA